MTVTELLLNFRQALIAVIPAFQRVGVPWERPDAYDEWDRVAAAMFEALVVDVLRWSLLGCKSEEFRMPEYDLLLESYDAFSVLEVSHPTLQHGRHVFHCFKTDKEPFDVVELRRISKDDVSHKQRLFQCAVDRAIFRLRPHPSIKLGDVVEEIDI